MIFYWVLKMGALVAPFPSQTFFYVHLFSFGALSTTTFEDDGGRSTGSEMPIALLLLARSADVASDPEELARWLKDFKDEVIGGSTTEDYFSASWAPLQAYNKGKGKVHRLGAQGTARIDTSLCDRNTLSLVSTTLVQKELAITTTRRIIYLASRLVASRKIDEAEAAARRKGVEVEVRTH